MSPLPDPTVQLVSAAQWATAISRLLRQRGAPTQVVPAGADPAGEAAELVVWGAGAAAFSCQQVPERAALAVAAQLIHNPDYPDQA